MSNNKNIKILCPAKINLFLRVLNKRDDGYHEIETFMNPIRIFDTMRLSVNMKASKKNISVTCDYPDIPQHNENIAFKAADIFLKNVDKKCEIDISIKKRIPTGAGLGGGSSNAGSLLLKLNEIFDFPFSQQKLLSIAASIGADVPFFILKKPAAAYGIGENLFPFLCMPPFFVIVVFPGVQISTKWAYEKFDSAHKLTLTKNEKKIRKLCFSDLKSYEDILKQNCNDFEKIVFVKHKIVKRVKADLLKNGANYASMSGSGSCVFGLFYDKLKAVKAFKTFYYLREKEWQIFFTRLIV